MRALSSIALPNRFANLTPEQKVKMCSLAKIKGNSCSAGANRSHIPALESVQNTAF